MAPASPAGPPGSVLRLPKKTASVRFAAIGDAGRGDEAQYEVSAQLQAFRKVFPYDFVLMLGDNVYDGGTAEDYRQKFELPYKPLLDDHLPFYATIGNHDDPSQPAYAPFHMNNQRYYTFKPPSLVSRIAGANVRFYMIDTERLDNPQLEWIDREMTASDADWKIPVFHRPIYTSGLYERPAQDAARRAGAAVCETQRDRGVFRPRTLLRTHQAAAGHHLFHLGSGRVVARGQHPPNGSDRGRIRQRFPFHAGRNRRR